MSFRSREIRPGIFTVSPVNPTLSLVNNRLTLQPGGSSVQLPGMVTPSLTLSNGVLTLQPGGSSVVLPTANNSILQLVTLDTNSPPVLTSNASGKYHLCSGGGAPITLPNAPTGSFIVFKNLTSNAIGYTNLAGASNTASNTQVVLNTANGWIVL